MEGGSGGQEGTRHIGIAQNIIRLINNGHCRLAPAFIQVCGYGCLSAVVSVSIERSEMKA